MAPALLNQTVCVMDASGRLGSALVHRLLQRGYAVHAAVHNHDELQSFKRLSSENKKLRVFGSDPLDYHSLMEALKGCCGLFYSFELPSDNPTYDEFVGELEVRAAHNVLEACAQTDTIDKVVFTSSATAVIWRDQHNSVRSDVNERNWSDINFCKKFKVGIGNPIKRIFLIKVRSLDFDVIESVQLWHGLSKTVAEKTAWALAMDRGVNMVSINAGLLMHPNLSIKDPYLLGAAEMFKDGVFVAVDLGFLVDAHICVFEDSSSYGRYLCFNRVLNCSKDVVKLSSMLLPSSSPLGLEDEGVHEQKISSQKLSKLMVDFNSELQME
ncbi:cinnamoyl- reductase-like SNL6 [Olea europaea subsp. europaea]|uniref:Cinnamoyl- reductase-like SNL6 n=1 Tax=Olea europaea subsp. europaea TaxID=158383 RepID=A0A8S0T3B2_OLEEU|nr:cinnamoyl- reductase-like SNL6 [Olea europaea subsp. europaea]